MDADDIKRVRAVAEADRHIAQLKHIVSSIVEDAVKVLDAKDGDAVYTWASLTNELDKRKAEGWDFPFTEVMAVMIVDRAQEERARRG